ncbi:restriction endonuclease subunit S [Acinetobacter lwoffii]|nr:restriction endonuclease subunit S [Acinetobacter lwoffii]MCO8061722.1 restriction endonuclease subunit S [Acinetobacter lwoffii]
MALPKLRFKEFDSEWALQNLGSLFSKRRDKGISGVPTYSVTLNNGIVNRDDLERDTPTNLSPQEHLLVKKNDLAYNMMRMWQGALGLAPTDGIVSPAYVVLKPSEQKTNSNFFEYYFKRNRQIHNFWAYSQGLTEDRLRLYFDDFKVIKINAPSKEEQTKIASFLSAVDEKIAQLAQKHELLSQYKQGMMQKLFSQQIRFTEDNGCEYGEWGVKNFDEVLSTISIRNNQIQANQILEAGKIPVIDQGQRYIAGYTNDVSKALKPRKGFIIFGDHTTALKFVEFSFVVGADGVKVLDVTQEGNLAKYMYYYLSHNKLQPEGYKRHFTILREIEIQVPCLEEQTKIANFLSAIDEKIEKVAQQIEETKQWKKGLLQQMFV